MEEAFKQKMVKFKHNPLLIKNIRDKRLFLFLILFIGITLRLYKWNGYSLWYDEVIWMGNFLQSRLLSWLKNTVDIGKPPLFKFLLYLWCFLGQDEFILRLLPFIFGILSILVTYKVGKTLFNEKIGLVATFLISISPFHIYYSQELTHYSLTLFLIPCSIYYLIRSLKENKLYFWIGFIFFTSLSLYTNYLCIFLFMTENLFFRFSFGRYKDLIKKWFLSQLAILLLYLPWLLMLPRQFNILSTYPIDWIPRGSLFHIFQALRLFNVGYNANFIVHFFASLLYFPLLLMGIFSNLKKDGQKTKLLILWLFVPMILSILFSKIWPTFIYRNFIFTLPAYYLLIASGMIKLGRYICIPIFSFIILSSLSLFNYYRNVFPYPEDFYRPGVHAKKDNRAASKYIISNFKDGDIVVHTCPSTAVPYIYYFSVFKYKNKKEDVKDLFYHWESRLMIRSEDETSKFIEAHNKRIWLVFSFWEPQVLDLYPSMEENKIKQKLDNDFMMLEHREFEGIKIYLYKID